MFSRKFQRHEAMTIVCLPRRAERLVADRVIAGAARQIIERRAAARCDCAATVKIKTKFDAVRPETFSPIEWLTGDEIMPLDADSHFLEAAVELSPSVAHIGPGGPSGRF